MNQEQTSKNRLLFLDVLRIIAVSLVVYTHLFSCAMDANVLKNIVSGNDLPIFSMNFMYCFENFLQKFLHTNPASIGVALFFIIQEPLFPVIWRHFIIWRKQYLFLIWVELCWQNWFLSWQMRFCLPMPTSTYHRN